jgi:hypothetical protein
MTNSHFSHNGFQISVVKDFQAWNGMASEWNILWKNTPDASVFMSHGFLTTWWRHIKSHVLRLHILIVKDSNRQIVGFVPLIRGRGFMNGFPLRTLTLMHQAWLIDRPQMLYSGNRRDLMEALCHYFISISQSWDVVSLQEQILGQSAEPIFTLVFKSNQEYRLDIFEDSFAPFLSLQPAINSWDDYLKTRTKKHRKKWRYLQNRIDCAGDVKITRHSEGADLGKALDLFRQLEQKSWKKSKRVYVSKWHYKFYKKFIDPNHDGTRIHVLLLHLDKKPIAGVIGLEHGRKYAALHSSFDKDFARYSPGFLIGGLDLKWAIENGFAEYDFMSGFLSDKLQWTDSYRRTHYIRVIRKCAWGGVFNLVKFRVNPWLIKCGNKNAFSRYWITRKDRKRLQMNTSKFDKHNRQLGIAKPSKKP